MTATPYRILVTGGRSVSRRDVDLVWAKLELVAAEPLAEGRPVIVVEGRCPYGGVDLVAQRWAEQTAGVTDEGHPAERDPSGKLLGPARNQRMVDAEADICVAFPMPGSRGTWDCLRRAADAGIPGRVYPIEGKPR
jgi:hypothetical protein